MDEVSKIYKNKIGITFKWLHVEQDLIQIIFRNIGFYLSEDDILYFLENIEDSKSQKQCSCCHSNNDCQSILLQTPSEKISIAVSVSELEQIEDLLRGTLFQIQLNDYLEDVCKN